MSWNFEDFTEFYECSGTGALIGENGFDILEQGTVPEVAGKFGTARGPCDPTQSGITSGFQRSVSIAGPWDTRVSQGFLRGSLVGWFNQATNVGDQEFAHQARVAAPNNTKQWMLRTIFQDLEPGHDGPLLFLWNHTLNQLEVAAAVRADQGPMPTGVWCAIGFSVDLVSARVRLFLGVPGEGTYFDERAINPAWNAFEATAIDVVAIGRNSGGSSGGLNGNIDHITWTKGRAYGLADFQRHWNGGAGLERANYKRNVQDVNPLILAAMRRGRGD